MAELRIRGDLSSRRVSLRDSCAHNWRERRSLQSAARSTGTEHEANTRSRDTGSHPFWRGDGGGITGYQEGTHAPQLVVQRLLFVRQSHNSRILVVHANNSTTRSSERA